MSNLAKSSKNIKPLAVPEVGIYETSFPLVGFFI